MHTSVKIYIVRAAEQSLILVCYNAKKIFESYQPIFIDLKHTNLLHTSVKIYIARGAEQSLILVCYNAKKSFSLTNQYLFVSNTLSYYILLLKFISWGLLNKVWVLFVTILKKFLEPISSCFKCPSLQHSFVEIYIPKSLVLVCYNAKKCLSLTNLVSNTLFHCIHM